VALRSLAEPAYAFGAVSGAFGAVSGSGSGDVEGPSIAQVFRCLIGF
jgi:hypothetical protein